MTTTIIVQANHGWPVDVFAHDKPGEESKLLARVAPGASETFHVHSTRDLCIHEVQPDEIEPVRAVEPPPAVVAA